MKNLVKEVGNFHMAGEFFSAGGTLAVWDALFDPDGIYSHVICATEDVAAVLTSHGYKRVLDTPEGRPCFIFDDLDVDDTISKLISELTELELEFVAPHQELLP